MGSFCSRNRKHPERPEEQRSDHLTQEVMHILSPLSTSKSIGGLVGDNEQGTEARTERRESVATDFGFWLEGYWQTARMWGDQTIRVCNILLVDFTVPEVDPIRLPLGRLEFREMVRTNVDEITVRRTWTTVLDKVSDELVDIPELDNVRTKNCKAFLISVSMIRERWLYPFYKGDSVKAVFHKQRNEKIEINMMRQTGFFNYLYLTNMRSQVVEMPLSDETFSVFIILPDKKMKFQRLDKWTKRMDMRDVLRQVNKPVMLEISVPTGYVQSVTTEKMYKGKE